MLQEDHYYPFGLNINALSSTAPLSKPNKFKYNGKEEQTDFDLDWYDYGARMYNPTIGRWNAVDPLADIYESYSPYHYGMNNPIRFVDPDGMSSRSVVDLIEKAWDETPENGSATFDGEGNKTSESQGCPDGNCDKPLWRRVLAFLGWADDQTTEEEFRQGNQDRRTFHAAKETVMELNDMQNSLLEIMPGGFIMIELKDGSISGNLDSKKIAYNLAEGSVWMLVGGKWVKSAASKIVDRSDLLNNAVEQATKWLGKDFDTIINKAGDKIFLSKDGKRKIRFDINNSQGDAPHIHLEVLNENGNWKDALKGQHRIYPMGGK
ncbi:RHS repeat domain-containing protein [Roseivirga seohaensis]|uniref:RHS repeat domain-containing protein n=1 Tax=Roseivirga seohaensis TaxID=1914963 RepID=UPI003BA8BD6F